MQLHPSNRNRNRRTMSRASTTKWYAALWTIGVCGGFLFRCGHVTDCNGCDRLQKPWRVVKWRHLRSSLIAANDRRIHAPAWVAAAEGGWPSPCARVHSYAGKLQRHHDLTFISPTLQALASGARSMASTHQPHDRILLKGLVFHGYHGVLKEVTPAELARVARRSSRLLVALAC